MGRENDTNPHKAENNLDILSEPPRYNWNDIAYFLELARHEKLVDAARRLKVNHTTVSRRVRELEKALDCKLFSRTKSGFLLTEAGLKVLEHAEIMEKSAITVAQKKGFEPAQAGGAVRVATMEGIGSFYLGPKMVSFQDSYPAILLELVTASRWINLSRQEADIFISFSKPDERRLKAQKVGKFRVFLFASKTYLTQKGEPKSKSDLKNHDFVDYIDELIQIHAVRWLYDIVSAPKVVFRSTSLIAQYSSVSRGLGIAALPTFVAAQNPNLKLVTPSLFTSRDIWLSVHQDLEHVPRVRSVTRFCTEMIEQDNDFLMGN